MQTELMDPREVAEAEALFAKAAGGDLVTHQPGAANPAQGMLTTFITAPAVVRDRDLSRVIRNIKTLAAVAGENWYYSFPVKKKGGGTDRIEGPSIKCAENVAREYGNCDVVCFSLDQGSSWLFLARFVDRETGFSLIRPFQADKAKTSINTKDAGRQQEIAYSIGVSKATRNVIVHALETFTNLAKEEAKNNLIEKVGKKLDEYRKRVRERLSQIKVDEKRVELMIGRKADEWLAPEVARVIAELKAIADGMASADETWPPLPPAEPTRGDFQKKEGDTDKSTETEGDETGKAAATEPDGKAEGDAVKGDAAGQASEPQKKSWKLADSVVGQQAKLGAIHDLLTMAEIKSEVDDIEAEHKEFLGKLGPQVRAETTKAFADRKAELPEKASPAGDN